MDQILAKLFEGSTKDACNLAVSGGIWPIAIILGSRISQEVYSDVVMQFSTNWFDNSAVIPSTRIYPFQILLAMMGGSDPGLSNHVLT
jgi:Sec23-binding domain of Sec16